MKPLLLVILAAICFGCSDQERQAPGQGPPEAEPAARQSEVVDESASVETKPLIFYHSVTVEGFLKEDDFWVPCAVALALGYEVVTFSDTRVTLKMGAETITRPMEDAPPELESESAFARILPRFIPIKELAEAAGFSLTEFGPSRLDTRSGARYAKYFSLKYSRRLRVHEQRETLRSWYDIGPSNFEIGPLRYSSPGATFGLDSTILYPRRESERPRPWTDNDPNDTEGLYSLEVFAEVERTDDSTEPFYTSDASWAAHFSGLELTRPWVATLPARGSAEPIFRRITVLQPGHTYGGYPANRGWGSTYGMGWDDDTAPVERKRTAMRFWAPAGAKPDAIEYFDGRRHLRLSLVPRTDPRTDPAPLISGPNE